MQKSRSGKTYWLLFVGDLLIACDVLDYIQDINRKLSINQRIYVIAVFVKFSMVECNPVKTPMSSFVVFQKALTVVLYLTKAQYVALAKIGNSEGSNYNNTY